MKQNALMEFYSSLEYFFTHYRKRTIAVFGAAFVLSGLEMISVSMYLPLLSLGIDSNINVPLVSYIKNTFSFIGISFNFYYVFFIFILSFLIKTIMELFLGIFIDMSSVLIARNFRKKVIDGIREVSWGYLTHKPHGLLVNLMTQEINRATGIFNMLKTVIISGFMMAVYIALGVAVSFKLFIAATLMGLLSVLIARPMFEMARRAGAGYVENMRDLSTDLLQGIQAYKVFKAMARERELLTTLSNANEAFVNANRLNTFAQRLLTASQQIVLIISAVLGVYIARDVLGIGIVEIGFMGIVMLRLNAHLTLMLKKFQGIANMHYALDKFEEFHKEIVDHTEPKTGFDTPTFPSPIRFDKVTFKHGERVILDEVSMTIPANGLTAIMGPSGSGKTTIIDIICGFHELASGRVMIGDKELASLKLREWRKHIGYVTQEPNLLHKSIANNVAAFDKTLSENDIIEALKRAQAWPFIEKLEKGLDRTVGEGGTGLSGGERQRISIARALAKKPKLLILDEPTASVDYTTYRELITTFNTLKKTIPIILVTHQEAMTEIADYVYRLDSGKISLVKNPNIAGKDA